MKRILLFLALLVPAHVVAATPSGITWLSWSSELFQRAQREHRFVLLDLGAVWCHWCHVMEETTYRDPQVTQLLFDHYLAVKADEDADPDLSKRYEDHGWPATIIFTPDGKELIKRRGYLPPGQMAAILREIVDDPTPGPSVRPEIPWQRSERTTLAPSEKRALEKAFVEHYDRTWGGWGQHHKFLDPEATQLALADRRFNKWARQTLDHALLLIDPVFGGMYQYSEALDWRSPHFEKIMSVQASAIELYVEAYRRFGAASYRKGAEEIARYVTSLLSSPEGAFYVSQDADLDEKTPGRVYYAGDAAQRQALGQPRIDMHVYPRENGWAIAALAHLYMVNRDATLLARCRRATAFIEENRALEGGGFRHGAADRAGPYLGDTLAMAQAYLALDEADPDAQTQHAWRAKAEEAAGFIEANFRGRDDEAGFVTAPAAADAAGVFKKAARLVDENVQVALLATALQQRTGNPRWRTLRDHAMRLLTSPTLLAVRPFSPTVLLLK